VFGVVSVLGVLLGFWLSRGLAGHHLLHAANAGRPEPILAALEARPQDSGLWELLGEAYAHSNRHAEAVSAYRRSLALDPANDETWWMLGITQVCRKDVAGVAEVQEKLATLDRKSSEEFAKTAPHGCCAFGGCTSGS
jgi:predicted Zn-dependent protease